MSQLYYNYYLSCWVNGTVTQEQLQRAVTKGQLTQAEYEQIIATPQKGSQTNDTTTTETSPDS